jgi:hypothetical protein
VGNALDSGQGLDITCQSAATRLRILIEEANAIANGEIATERGDTEPRGDVGGQAAIDALFGTR